jgi:hypothetical protein
MLVRRFTRQAPIARYTTRKETKVARIQVEETIRILTASRSTVSLPKSIECCAVASWRSGAVEARGEMQR